MDLILGNVHFIFFWVINVDTHDTYPGYTGDLEFSGSVSLNLFDDSVMINYDLTGMDSACSAPTTGNFEFDLLWIIL